MPTRRQLIQKVTLNSDSSSVTFSGIPQNYTDLKLVVSARTNQAAYFDNALIRFNNDSGSNYSWRGVYGYNGSAYSDYVVDTGFQRVYATGSSATANTFGHTVFSIPGYSDSRLKICSTSAAAESNHSTGPIVYDGALLWNSTAAITNINITSSNSKNFIAGSTFYLYGITHVPIIRGGEEYVLNGFKYHKFTSTSALQVIEPGDVEALIVSGGGGGAHGGGGAGGLKLTKAKLYPGSSLVTIGAGGTSTWYWVGGSANSGSSSSINSISSTGGGAGGSIGSAGGAGGSGGGGGGGPSASVYGGDAVSGEGNVGGLGGGYSNNQGAAGGGGAGASGSPTASAGIGGVGGSGRFVFDSYYAGGGGGGGNTLISGGVGGGGSGAGGSSGLPATAGLQNTGGGGGGCFGNGTSGGSGIVIIRYPYDGN